MGPPEPRAMPIREVWTASMVGGHSGHGKFVLSRGLSPLQLHDFEDRRFLVPDISAPSLFEGIVEQSLHVIGVERLTLFLEKVGLDEGQVEIKAVVFRGLINSYDIVITEIMDHRVDRALDNRQEVAVD